jgi:hypothetical protein
MKNKILIVILAICLQAVLAFAQTTTGRLSGVVSGPDGVLPNATIVARDNKTNRELTVNAKEDGTFLFPQLEFGTYTVTITVTGFKTFIANEVKIDVGRDYSLNPVLEIGSIQESVTITAGADVITTNSAEISNTVSPQQILSLPLLNRNPLALTTLQAGTQSSTAQNTTINGMRTSFTNITRDGINIQDAFIRTNATDFAPGRPTVDDTAEFTITTSNQEADQGNGGAQIRLVTPRGGNRFSGAAFGYNRNSAFAANNFFSNRSGLELPFRNRNQFGGKLSGPFPVFNFGEGGPMFLKNKGFFFTSYEKIIDPLSTRATRTILTPGARTGEFRYTRAIAGPAINTTIGTATVTCPATTVNNTGTCVVSNILGFAQGINFAGFPNPNIPTTIDPAIQQMIISQLPTTSNFTGGDQLNTAGFTLNRKANTERTTTTNRVDLDFNERNTMNVVYSWVREGALRTDLDVSFSETPRASLVSESQFLTGAYRRIFSPTIVNEFRAGIFFSDVIFTRDEEVPAFFLTVPLVSNPMNQGMDQGRRVKNYNVQDNVDWVAGKHNFKFGGQLQYFRPTSFNLAGTIPRYFVQTISSTPQFTCPSAANCNFPGGISSGQLGTANNMLGLMGGFVVQGQRTYFVSDPTVGYDEGAIDIQPFRYANHSLYFSDRWMIRPDLTITAGVRYEVFPALKLNNGLALEPVVPPGMTPEQAILRQDGIYDVIGGNSGVRNTYYKTDYNNLAPNIGFAWSPKFSNRFARFLLSESFVVRGGYSHIYSNDQIVTATDSAANSNVGLASVTGFARGTPTSSNLINARLGQGDIPPFQIPAFTPPPRTYLQNNALANGFGTVFLIDPNLETSMVKQYNIGIQRQLPGNMALEVRYVGTRSDNLIRAYDLNQVDIFNNGFFTDYERARANIAAFGTAFCNPNTVAGCQALQIFRNAAAPANANQIGNQTGGQGLLLVGGPTATGLAAATFNNNLTGGTPAELAFQFYSNANNYNNHPTLTNPNAVPRINFVPNPATGVVDLFTNSAFYKYDSLQIELRRRFSQGLYFQANYTLSKNITNAVGSLNAPLSGQSQFEPFLDINRPELDIRRADYDQRHVFNFNGVYQLPFGKGRMFLNRGGVIDRVFGGWEISGLLNWTSGIPITFVDPRGTFNRGARSGRQTASSTLSAREIRALMGTFERDGRLYWINPDVICPNGAATTGFGQTPCQGQVFFNNAPGEIGNLENTVVNGPGYFNINAAILKNIRFTERTRVQLRAEAFNLLNNVNWSLGGGRQYESINSTSFGQITAATSPRIIQFGVRFEF